MDFPIMDTAPASQVANNDDVGNIEQTAAQSEQVRKTVEQLSRGSDNMFDAAYLSQAYAVLGGEKLGSKGS